MGDATDFPDWATQALAHYGLQAPAVTMLGQRENITFRVQDTATGELLLLRLHRPRTHTLAGARQRPDAIESELRWLVALADDTPLCVPQPIHNRSGELVTLLQLGAGETLPCSVLRWVEGEPFPEEGPAAEAAAAALGQLLAALHHHAATWTVPDAFVRPSYDAAFVQHVSANLQLGVAAGVIAPRDLGVLHQTIEVSGQIIASLPRARNSWGVIHADLHPGNCLVAKDSVRPIDFSLCGFGHYLFDLGTSLGSLSVALRKPLFDAYAAAYGLPEHAIRLVEAFFIISRMSSYGFALPDTEQHAWLRRRIPQVVETICQPFLQEENFLFVAR
jgi:Ser/Thr protein kinase RdoA (MazF antagonist)